jgi:DNA-binding MarR family transcriptional regulator
MSHLPDSHFTDLPFLIAGLTLGFQALIKRLRADAGLREDVAIGMGSIFFALCEDDDCIMKDLAARLRMPKGTLSGLVARMESMGLIERAECPQDGRAFRLRLTRKARIMETPLRARHQRATEILQAGLSAAEVSELQRLLESVLENLRKDQSLPDRGTGCVTKSRPLAAT